MTVSRVINGERGVRAQTRQAVLEAIGEPKQKRGGGKVERTTATLAYELIRRDSDAAPTLAKRAVRGEG